MSSELYFFRLVCRKPCSTSLYLLYSMLLLHSKGVFCKCSINLMQLLHISGKRSVSLAMTLCNINNIGKCRKAHGWKSTTFAFPANKIFTLGSKVFLIVKNVKLIHLWFSINRLKTKQFTDIQYVLIRKC